MQIKQAILEMNSIKRKLDVLNKQYSQKRSFIIGMFDKKNIDSFKVKNIQAKVTHGQKVVYDAKRLKKVVSKKVYKQIVAARYSVIDEEKFAKCLKVVKAKLGDKFYKEFRKSFLKEPIINDQALNDLFETGEITLEDLSGCYEIQSGQTRLNLRQLREGED